MSVQEVQAAIASLSRDERQQIRAWLDCVEAEARERQPVESRQERRDRQLAAIIHKGHEEFGSFVGGRRLSGLCAGRLRLPADFNEPLPEDVLRDIEGG